MNKIKLCYVWPLLVCMVFCAFECIPFLWVVGVLGVYTYIAILFAHAAQEIKKQLEREKRENEGVKEN